MFESIPRGDAIVLKVSSLPIYVMLGTRSIGIYIA